MRPQSRRIGILVPASDPVVESDFQAFLPTGFTFHTMRLFQPTASRAATLGTLETLAAGAPKAAKLLAQVDPELIVFCCTSASLHRGFGWDMELATRIVAASGIPALTTATCIVDALKALAMKRVFMITPYPPQTVDLERQVLADHGIEIAGSDRLPCKRSQDIGRITADQIEAKVHRNRYRIADCDGLFVSCTALRAFEIAAAVEKVLGQPVITSNQATLWRSLIFLGAPGKNIPGGQIFAKQYVRSGRPRSRRTTIDSGR